MEHESSGRFEDSVGRFIQPGRLTIICCNGYNIRSKDSNLGKTQLTLSLRFSLSLDGVPVNVASSRTYIGMHESPDFGDEVVSLDLRTSRELLLQHDIVLKIELLHHNKHIAEVIGQSEIKLSYLLCASSSAKQKERFDLIGPGAITSTSAIDLEFLFAPINEGLLTIFIQNMHEALKEEDQDATLQVIHGDTFSEDIQGNVKEPSEIQLHLRITEENWFHEIKILLIKSGKLLAKASIDPLGFNMNEQENDFSLELITSNQTTSNPFEITKPYAIIKSKIRFLTSGKVCLKAVNVSSLFSSTKKTYHGFQLVLSTNGIASNLTEVMKIAQDTHNKAAAHSITLNVLDHDEIKIDCYSLDAIGNKHTFIGSGHMSLLPVYNRGTYDSCIQLKTEDIGNSCIPLFFSFEFQGRGQRFPKLHPLASSITEPFTKTSNLPKCDDFGIHQLAYSDEDIKSTFELCDLDQNGYIGAAELRHVLICLGELVTEEEIYTMINMLDRNGDGQIDMRLFSIMAKSSTLDDIYNLKADIPSQHTDMYQERHHMMASFVEKFNISRDTLNEFCDFLYQRRNSVYSEPDALEMDPLKRSNSIWRISFSSLQRILRLDATNDLKDLYDILNPDQNLTIDARRFILGVMNFIKSYSTYERTSVMFDLYDEGRSGLISSDDLLSILAATNMKPRETVRRKLETVLKVVDDYLTHEDLLNVATKFPNLLFSKLNTSKGYSFTT